MDHDIKLGTRFLHCVVLRDIDRSNRIRFAGQMRGRLGRMCPAFHFPSCGQKQVTRRGADVTAAGHQDRLASAYDRGDLDFLEGVRLNRPHLFQPDQLEQGRNVTTISTREAIRANNSENRTDPPPVRVCRIRSILSDTVKFSPKISRKSSFASSRLSTF